MKYVEAHKADLDKISGIFVHDTGTGRVLTLGLHDNYQDREIVDQEIAPLRELKLLEPSMQRSFGTDHASFDDVGVPGFWAIQDRRRIYKDAPQPVGYLRQSVERRLESRRASARGVGVQHRAVARDAAAAPDPG